LTLSGSYGSTSTMGLTVQDGSDSIAYQSKNTAIQSTLVDFSLAMKDNRKKAELSLRAFPEENNTSTFYDTIANTSVSSLDISNPSQEFVIQFNYYASLNGFSSGDANLVIGNFQFTTRDIFIDIAAAVGNVVGGIIGGIADFFGSLFVGIFNWFANIIFIPIFRWLIGALSSLGSFIVTGLTSVINALQPFLTAITSAVNSIGEAITSAVTTIGSNITTAIGNIASQIWSAFTSAAGDFVNSVITAVTNVLSTVWTSIVQPLINDILGIINDFIDAMVGAGSYLLDQALAILPFGLGSFFTSFNNLTIDSIFTQIFNFINWVISLWNAAMLWLMFLLGFYIFGLPLVSNMDNPGNAMNDMLHNAFAMHGFDFNAGIATLNGTIPIRANAIAIWLMLLIVYGYLSYILPFSLF